MSVSEEALGVSRWWCAQALLPDGAVASGVLLTAADGRFTAVEPGVPAPAGAPRLGGLVMPGMADAHSHAFHRALRGRTHGGGHGTFWTWREQMYAAAERLDPDRYLALARAAFAESALAGCVTVGEFHYLHHGPDGRPYDDPNAVGHALVQAAREAGVRLTLLDTCYLTSGIGQAPEGVQLRFSDGDADAWATRVEALRDACADADDVVVGAAVHSVRAVPAAQIRTVVAAADRWGAPLHAHVSEQRAENAACLETTGRTPTALLDEAGALGERFSAVHGTHLTDDDLARLGGSGSSVCLCPTTERDLADGVGPAGAMRDIGIRLSFGSDSRAVVDHFAEARAAEMDLRLVTSERGHLSTADLLRGLTSDGQSSLGFADAGRLEVGARADLVAVRLDSVRTAGASPADAAVVWAASASDVTDVVVDGRAVVTDGAHRLGDIARLLDDAVRDLMEDP